MSMLILESTLAASRKYMNDNKLQTVMNQEETA